MKNLLKRIIEETDKGKDLILMSVVSSSGSTPREAGSRMLLFDDGTIYGTIGGGSVEYNSIKYGKTFLKDKESGTHSFMLTQNEVEDIGMVCGGTVVINFYYIGHKNLELIDGFKSAYTWANNNENFIIVESPNKGISFIEGDEVKGSLPEDLTKKIKEALKERSKSKIIIDYEESKFFVEEIKRKIRVILFGAGHVSQALAPILSYLDFNVLVCDDREEFITKERFPSASERILIDFSKVSDYIDIGANDYLCVLTRGHKYDEVIQAQALKTKAPYIGVIGSRRKKKSVDMRLKERGFSDKDIERIVSPIGIDIACETPREIGISIAAQLIDLRLKSAN
ncbi:XdhC family protein [Peptoniphilus catoniae]|uniref:XdhC family protein n=1 Tax=Peptoniphilus catoniae TaxID=1660341 RepID=UPI0010FE8EF3|nr:XdhC/CoxI family protein [Peptoniphilus catoniae]